MNVIGDTRVCTRVSTEYLPFPSTPWCYFFIFVFCGGNVVCRRALRVIGRMPYMTAYIVPLVKTNYVTSTTAESTNMIICVIGTTRVEDLC